MKENKISIIECSAYHLPFYGVVAFVTLNIIAMVLYPGGTYQNPEFERYMFTQNYFSDLGRTLAMDKTSNFLSCIIFNNSLLIIGLIMAIFYYYLPNLFKKNKFSHKLSMIGSILAITSGFAFMGIGLTPSDLYLDEHIFFVRWAFRSFLIAAIIYIIAIYNAPEWEKKYALIYLGFAIILFLYILIMDFGPDGKNTIEGLIIQAVAQKVIAFTFVISVYFKSRGAKINYYKL